MRGSTCHGWTRTPVYEDPAAVAQRLNDQISGAVEQRVQALTDPMREQMAEMRRDQQARDLAAEFPEIATDEMAQQIAGPGGLAAQMADQLGQPGLAAEPSSGGSCTWRTSKRNRRTTGPMAREQHRWNLRAGRARRSNPMRTS
jgi:hypothetical protein